MPQILNKFCGGSIVNIAKVKFAQRYNFSKYTCRNVNLREADRVYFPLIKMALEVNASPVWIRVTGVFCT
jgi:hypothetical protein